MPVSNEYKEIPKLCKNAKYEKIFHKMLLFRSDYAETL